MVFDFDSPEVYANFVYETAAPRFLSTGKEFVNACWLGKPMTFLFYTLPALTLRFIEFFRTNGFNVLINV